MLIVDTGVLLASMDTADPHHEVSAAVLRSASGPLVTTPLVVAETSYLVDRQLGPKAEAEFFRHIEAGAISLAPIAGLLGRIAVLIDEYDDLPLGGTDASLVALAERAQQSVIATLDQRHFSVVRPKHCEAFEIVPTVTRR